MQAFQSTPPAWGATGASSRPNRDHVVSIHAPRVGGDIIGIVPIVRGCLFQSTPPAWGATSNVQRENLPPLVSIHAPRVGGDRRYAFGDALKYVSIHAPRVGGDRPPTTTPRWSMLFQSTPPAWGATAELLHEVLFVLVSIHAPRVGGDLQHGLSRQRHAVSIHAPRVGGDNSQTALRPASGVSIHAPRVGGDRRLQDSHRVDDSFNPRPPRGGRPLGARVCGGSPDVSIHAPRVGGDAALTTLFAAR